MASSMKLRRAQATGNPTYFFQSRSSLIDGLQFQFRPCASSIRSSRRSSEYFFNRLNCHSAQATFFLQGVIAVWFRA